MDNKIKFTIILLTGVAIILVATLISLIIPSSTPEVGDELKQFNSLDDIKTFLKANVGDYGYGYGMGAVKAFSAGVSGITGASAETAGADDYSTTNIQVEGVDEPDIVKNDDKYIYTVNGNKVVITEAYPAESMKIISEIDINKTVSEIFINDDKLIIFSQDYGYVPCTTESIGECGGYSGYQSLVYIYDVSDKENPELERDISIEGSYRDSRMIGNYVYVISQKYVEIDEPTPPIYFINGIEKAIAPSEVYYFDYPDTSYVFSSIMAINVNENEETVKTYLTGYTNDLYVSQDNIYLTAMKRIPYRDYVKKYVDEIEDLLPIKEKGEIEEIMSSDKAEYEKMREIQEIIYDYSSSLTGDEKENFDKKLIEKLQAFEIKIQKETEKTVINKINVDNKKIEYVGSGEVPGNVLNQFSMDEYKGNFRIATTTGGWRDTSLNHLYILDEDLEIIGKVEDLAKGERIYSARFMGDRAYIVTFKKVDPLFVIDVSKPENPKVLGYLKITGYSDYLHPYDENHVIGIGKETAGGDEHFSWYQGIKISLFDVSDVENPVEEAKIVIGDRGTDSPALYDHKAFLFDKEKKLLVIPIMLAEIDESQYNGNVPDNAYGEHVWQGAYVLNIDSNDISLRGKITHLENQSELENYWGYYGKYSVKRSLFMDDYLYTISDGKIKANNLETVEEISSVDLPYEENRVYYAY